MSRELLKRILEWDNNRDVPCGDFSDLVSDIETELAKLELEPVDRLPAHQRLVELQTENFALSAGQCCVNGGLVGDDGGSPCCALKARIDGGVRVKAYYASVDRIAINAFSHAWNPEKDHNATLILDEGATL